MKNHRIYIIYDDLVNEKFIYIDVEKLINEHIVAIDKLTPGYEIMPVRPAIQFADEYVVDFTLNQARSLSKGIEATELLSDYEKIFIMKVDNNVALNISLTEKLDRICEI